MNQKTKTGWGDKNTFMSALSLITPLYVTPQILRIYFARLFMACKCSDLLRFIWLLTVTTD